MQYQERTLDVLIGGTNGTALNSTWNMPHKNQNDEGNIDYYNMKFEARYATLTTVQKYYVPTVCLLGLVGNIASVVVFLNKYMRAKSCVSYLLCKCVADIFFLVSLFVVWLDSVDIPWNHYEGVCQIIVLMTYVSGFLSVWMVVMVTLENFVCICYPQRLNSLCTPRKAKSILLALILFSLLCYHFPIWTTHTQLHVILKEMKCSQQTDYVKINEGLAYVDTALTLVIPSLLVFFFTYTILKTIFQTFIRIRRQVNTAHSAHSAPDPCQREKKHLFCQTAYGQISVMLLAESIAFIMIHTPSHVGRLYMIYIYLFPNEFDVFTNFIFFQRSAELIFYLNFAVNFFIFIFGKAFRCLLMRYCCACSPCVAMDDGQFESRFDECVCKSTNNERQQESRDNVDV